MSAKKPRRYTYVLGGEAFATKTAAKERVRAILHAHHDARVAPEHAPVLHDVLEMHPRAAEKIGAGVTHFEVRREPGGSTWCFYAHRVDGTSTEFSALGRCFDGDNKHVDVQAALRNEVRAQVDEFRAATFAQSAGTVKSALSDTMVRADECHVDHFAPDFVVLAANFMRERGLDSVTVALEDGGDNCSRKTLADAEFAAAWRAYHAANAHLRIVTPLENLTRKKYRQRGDGGDGDGSY